MCFLSGVWVFTVVYALLYAPGLVISYIILLIISSHHLRFTHIYWDFLGRIRVKHGSHLCFLLCFPLLLFVIWRVRFLYKYRGYCPSHLEAIRIRTPINLLSYFTTPPHLVCNATPLYLHSILHIAVKIVHHSHMSNMIYT